MPAARAWPPKPSRCREQAESALHGEAVRRALDEARLQPRQIDLLLAGDLLNQCMATTFGVRPLHIPLAGVYGACSTMAELAHGSYTVMLRLYSFKALY